MRWVRSLLPLAAPLTLMAGCGAREESAATLSQIAPALAYNDTAIPLILVGGPFRPAVEIATYTGTSDVGQTPFQVLLDPLPPIADRHRVIADQPQWKGETEVDAIIPAGISAGDYLVSLRDPRGNLVPSPILFRALGPDLNPPRITFLQPGAGTAVADGEVVTVVAHIDDGPGKILYAQGWITTPSLGQVSAPCPLDDNLRCSFSFTAHKGAPVLETIELRIDAEDARHNEAIAYLRISVAWPPAISHVTPTMGSAEGGTPIVIAGTNFVANLSRVLVDGAPIGGVVCGDSIQATTGRHVPGPGRITVSNGDSSSEPLGFTFVARPNVRLIDPSHAVADPPPKLGVAGNDFKSTTEFYWFEDGGPQHPFAPSTDLNAPPPAVIFINDSRVQLNLLPGSGTIGIGAHDDISGSSETADAFTFDPAP